MSTRARSASLLIRTFRSRLPPTAVGMLVSACRQRVGATVALRIDPGHGSNLRAGTSRHTAWPDRSSSVWSPPRAGAPAQDAGKSGFGARPSLTARGGLASAVAPGGHAPSQAGCSGACYRSPRGAAAAAVDRSGLLCDQRGDARLSPDPPLARPRRPASLNRCAGQPPRLPGLPLLRDGPLNARPSRRDEGRHSRTGTVVASCSMLRKPYSDCSWRWRLSSRQHRAKRPAATPIRRRRGMEEAFIGCQRPFSRMVTCRET